MQKWEYLTVTLRGNRRGDKIEFTVNDTKEMHESDGAFLNHLGAQGWELVAVESPLYHFKRPKQ